MKKIKIEAVVISEQSFGETSKILKLFTKDLGIISVMSKGCKKIKSPLYEGSNKLVVGNFDITYKENAMSILTGTSIIKIFKNIVMDYHDLDRKMYAFYITDLIVQVLKQEKITVEEINKIYDLYLSSLYKIDEKLNPKIIYDIVKLKYLEFLGVKPSIDCCSNCGSKEIVTCSSKTYGFICKNCYTDELILKNDTLKMIRMLYYVDINKIKKLEIDSEILKEVEIFIDDYYEEHTGIYFKSKKEEEILAKINGIIN